MFMVIWQMEGDQRDQHRSVDFLSEEQARELLLSLGKQPGFLFGRIKPSTPEHDLGTSPHLVFRPTQEELKDAIGQ